MTGLSAMTPGQKKLRLRMVTRSSPTLSPGCSSWEGVTMMSIRGARGRSGAYSPGQGAGCTSPRTGTGSMTPAWLWPRATPGEMNGLNWHHSTLTWHQPMFKGAIMEVTPVPKRQMSFTLIRISSLWTPPQWTPVWTRVYRMLSVWESL